MWLHWALIITAEFIFNFYLFFFFFPWKLWSVKCHSEPILVLAGISWMPPLQQWNLSPWGSYKWVIQVQFKMQPCLFLRHSFFWGAKQWRIHMFPRRHLWLTVGKHWFQAPPPFKNPPLCYSNSAGGGVARPAHVNTLTCGFVEPHKPQQGPMLQRANIQKLCGFFSNLEAIHLITSEVWGHLCIRSKNRKCCIARSRSCLQHRWADHLGGGGFDVLLGRCLWKRTSITSLPLPNALMATHPWLPQWPSRGFA